MPTPVVAHRTRPLIGWVRVVVGAAVILVVLYAYVEGAGHGRVNPFDYFGYFTNLTSLLTSGVLILTGVRALHGLDAPTRLVEARAVGTACVLVVAAIYNGLVPGTASAPPWVSAVLHAVFPCYAALDWLLARDRQALPWRRLWIVLPYPLLWLTVVLVRGATDGWVPYGFLLPERGSPSLLLHVAGLLIVLLVAGAAVWGAGRLPGPRAIARRIRQSTASQ
ncbi:Pr6Pr family membrane protein [Leucobacter sp. wl10]|uniref:Pr6Pr family membrane protein n=1 Tax=Leucobacter sp. wl10 TaxID=2304677 RepID=UPI001F098C4B|nr:Pr6Pr family membrane protein [Leucobacter sp. wl10]